MPSSFPSSTKEPKSSSFVLKILLCSSPQNQLLQKVRNRSSPDLLQKSESESGYCFSKPDFYQIFVHPAFRGPRFITVRKWLTFLERPVTPFQDSGDSVFMLTPLFVGHYRRFLLLTEHLASCHGLNFDEDLFRQVRVNMMSACESRKQNM